MGPRTDSAKKAAASPDAGKGKANKRQRRSKSSSAAAGVVPIAGAKPSHVLPKEQADKASDEQLLVEAPHQFAGRMRQLMATLFREQSQATGERFPLAAPKLGTNAQFTSEQVWGQLQVLYAPVLKQTSTVIGRLRSAADADATGSRQTAATKKRKDADDDAAAAMSDGFDDDEDFSDDDDGVSSAGALSSDAEVDRLDSRLRRRNRGGKKSGKGVDPDAWRYALGKPSELEDEDMSDDDAIGEDDIAPGRGRRGGGDDFDGEDDFEAESDMMDGDGDEEDEEGLEDGDDDASEADSAAALRELYGSDAEAGDMDDGDDEEGDDQDDDDDPFDENFGEFMEDRAGSAEGDDEEYEGDGDEEDAGAVAASPFGPQAAPENPLDFSDIDNNPNLTAFEKAEQRRLRAARDAEMTRVHGADWAMKGEVAANARPRDSLIDTTLDFEHALPPAPVVTEYFTAKLEDRIKRRIADGNFDDVERKLMHSTPEDLQTTKRDEALDAQKSKLSLMDLYEKEFLEKQAAAERAEGGPATAEALTEIERDELKAVQMWKRLSQHLDALSNFYFTPKPVNPEVEARVRAVQNQAPAITLESVGMTALAKEEVLAPQDVFRPKRGIHTDAAASELQPGERKAIRRAAKASTKAAEGRKEAQKAAREKKKSASAAGKKGEAAGKNTK
eukprot:CAMPEP_0174846172 /NCGR_PEP_ID=MMETSP1114-20130205/12161_1 /TAXON_ID=312471 /ORGANISM="Neobodo designis, Strain CCAP 1951/1" /LENGTH=673 /DNA_ID=CAMNT_0016080435 /DNA_START=40 /DNA_END=2061 /DNA_ORIENTATION=+